ncbi:MAG: transketolase [Atribacterota bacterium]|nr:transketolase [Atribacterota bacterium]
MVQIDRSWEKRIKNLKNIAKEVRIEIIKMIYQAQSGHPGGSLSAADILTVLYFDILNIDVNHPQWEKRDRFILSKGHSCPVWYVCLAKKGFFPMQELSKLRVIGGILQGHPDMKKVPGLDMTTGALGEGLSAGLGMALGAKVQKLDFKTYVLLGDGEINEGQIWEAAMSANKFHLNNLIAIIDYNNLQLDGYCHEVMPIEPLKDKWISFGWNVKEIDGHNVNDILTVLEKLKNHQDLPTVIIAHTIKGKGVSYMENMAEWHGKAPDEEQCKLAIQELEANQE